MSIRRPKIAEDAYLGIHAREIVSGLQLSASLTLRQTHSALDVCVAGGSAA